MNILLVCSGNTCRSPMAEALLRRRLSIDGSEDVSVGSAGTAAMEGEPASEGAYLVALEDGLDLSGHRARLLTPDLVASADLILTMSKSHLARAVALGGAGRTFLLGEFGGSGRASEIRDPFGADVSVYRETLAELRLVTDAVVRRLAEPGPP
jgi:protein-tyrosine-phosphatase